MNIALAFGPTYVTPARVLLRSLRQHCTGPIRYYFLHTQAYSEPLEAICQEFGLEPVQVRPERFQSLPRLASHSLEAYLPLCLADSLAELDRVLFLDADMLCLSDLRPLWETDLQGNILGAVTDLAIPTFSSPRGVRCFHQLGLPAGAAYFNAGMLLIDLKLWRESEVSQSTLDYLGRHPVHFLHQEALNVVLRDRWLALDPQWNVIASLYQRRYSPAPLAAVTQPALLHFAGRFKPWEVRTHGRTGEIYRSLCPALPGHWWQRWLGFYDCYLRDWLYPLENWYWRNR